MGAPKTTARAISQEAFNDLVFENINDLEMDPTEALHDAIQTLTLQGVDLSGIVTSLPGESNPVIECLEKLKRFENEEITLDEIVEVFDKLVELCGGEDGNGNAAIATKNGGVELVCGVCEKISSGDGSRVVLVSSLNALALLLHDVQSTGTFQNSNGPRIIIGIINDNRQNIDVLNSSFRVVASAATGDEIVKDSFMELKVDELIVEIMSIHKNPGIQSLYDAIRVLLTPDDNRVLASQVYGYARKFAKIGITDALVDSLHTGLSSPDLVSACITLKATAVNDEICKSIAEKGGIDVVLKCIDDSGEQGNTDVAKVCCSLLSKLSTGDIQQISSTSSCHNGGFRIALELFQKFMACFGPDKMNAKFRCGILAGSDANKSAIVGKGGMDKLIKLSARYADDPTVLQEIMSIISVLSLRSPENAARAIEAGAGDLAIQSMQKFPAAHQMQRNSCLMIRNLVARNPENRTILLNNGIEKHIRKAKQTHANCKEAATDALRDLGLDSYNL